MRVLFLLLSLAMLAIPVTEAGDGSYGWCGFPMGHCLAEINASNGDRETGG